MSEVIRYKGKLIKINKLNGEDLEKQCKRIIECKRALKGLNPLFRLRSCYDSYEDYLLSYYYEEFYINNGTLYRIEKKEVFIDSDIYQGYENKSGDIEFEVMYHNGCCCLSDALNNIFNKIGKGKLIKINN